ncbi:MAG: DUF3822 family protein [Bacteroidales bacterium]|jgi:hypothetical protein
MPDINLVDRSLQRYIDKTELSIQVSLSGFSFCIHTPEDSVVRAMRYYGFTNAVLQEDILNHVDEIMNKDELLRLPRKKTSIIFTGRKSTMIPYEFFRPDQLKAMLEFNHPLEDLEEIHYNNVPFSRSYLVFALPTYFAGVMSDKFGKVEFFNQATPLLAFADQLIGQDQGNCVLVNLNKEFFDIIVLKDNALRFINTFLYVNSVDLLYFILYVCKQLGIDAKQTAFHLAGEESDNPTLTSDLSQYITGLKKVNALHGIELADSLNDHIDASRHFTLLHLAACE